MNPIKIEPHPISKNTYKNLPLSLGKAITLDVPRQFHKRDFLEILERRASKRRIGSISKQDIGVLLWIAARTKQISISETGNLLQHRASPSAGGIHPISIFLIDPAIETARAQVYVYEPNQHSLVEVNLNAPAHLDSYVAELKSSFPDWSGVLLQFVGNLDQVAASYTMPDSLLWRDAGCLSMTIAVCAEYLQFNSCITGMLGHQFIQCLGLDSTVHIATGAIVVGS